MILKTFWRRLTTFVWGIRNRIWPSSTLTKDWHKTKKALMAGLSGPKAQIVDDLLERQRKHLLANPNSKDFSILLPKITRVSYFPDLFDQPLDEEKPAD